MEMDTSKYRDLFVSEAREHLQDMNRLLLDLEKEPGNLETLREIFRSAHTLKGMSATMGYDDLTALTHEMENLLDQLRAGNIEVTSETVDLFFTCVDDVERIIDSIAAGETEREDVDGLIAEIRSFAEGYLEAGTGPGTTVSVPDVGVAGGAEPQDVEGGVVGGPGGEVVEEKEEKGPYREAVSAPAREELDRKQQLEIGPEEKARYSGREGFRLMRLTVELDRDCLLKSVRVFMVFKRLAQMGEVISSTPSVEDLEDERFERSFQIGFATREDTERVRGELANIAEVRSVEAEVLFEVDEVAEKEGLGPEEAYAQMAEVAAPIPRKTQSVRINIERLDKLMNLVGELVINRTRLEEIASAYDISDLSEALDQSYHLTTELQDEVMKTRMVPVEHIFDRFPRMVRDLARSEGKEVELVIEGREIELDRSILDEISDPLVHMLRNAVDHGIAHPGEREKQGKPRMGTIKLSASRDRNYVSISVEDDGQGINEEAVFQRGLELGLVTEESEESLDDDELLRIISAPGFSSSGSVTGVSGRGVGMDAVKVKTEQLGGFVLLSTSPGEGTRVTLKLPITLAIIQALMVDVGGETYAIPLGTVRETQEVGTPDVKTVRGQELVVVRDETVPLLRLGRVFGVGESSPAGEPFPVVITEIGTKLLAVGVDRLIGQQEVVISALDRFLRRVEGFAGATILGTGRVALILDVPGILAATAER